MKKIPFALLKTFWFFYDIVARQSLSLQLIQVCITKVADTKVSKEMHSPRQGGGERGLAVLQLLTSRCGQLLRRMTH